MAEAASSASRRNTHSFDEKMVSVSSATCRAENRGSDERDHAEKSPRSGHARRIWLKVKEQYELVEFQALPDYLRDNEYILRYYRANWPLKRAILSIFSIHNETLNIWTHLLGFLFFLMLTIYTANKMPAAGHTAAGWSKIPPLSMAKLQEGIKSSLPALTLLHHSHANGGTQDTNETEELHNHEGLGIIEPLLHKQHTTRWPFFIFLVGAMFCLLTSSMCHLLSCHSSRLSFILWRLDYAGIAVMIATSFYPPVYYVFLCQPAWQHVYLSGISILGIATVAATLTPCLHTVRCRILRTWLFIGMGFSGIIPGAHALISNWHEPLAFVVLAYELAMVFCYLAGTMFYACRIPERWKPGLFDIAGHSHQIFHVLVIAGAYAHYKAALTFLEWRDTKGCS